MRISDWSSDVCSSDLDVVLVEYRDGGGAAAHVDHGGAQLQLVVDQRGEAGSVGRHHEGGRLQVAALDAGADVAHRARRGGDDMHVDPQLVAENTARVPDDAVAVARLAARDRMENPPAVVVVLAPKLVQLAVGQSTSQCGFVPLLTFSPHPNTR